MIELSKKCSKCGEVKLLGEFGVNKLFKDELHIYCKPCASDMRKAWRKSAPDKVREISKRCYLKNKKAISKYHKQWAEKNSQQLDSYLDKYHQSDVYIKSLICRNPEKREAIPQELITIKRDQVQLNRILKELRNVNKNR